jgi:hypothetical protein
MDHGRDYAEMVAQMMTPFGEFLGSVTVPRIDLHVMSKTLRVQEVAVKLKTMLDAQYGVLPDVIVIACKNWVDAWYGAISLGADIEMVPSASAREAAKGAFTYLLGQMIGIQALLDTWAAGGDLTTVME